MSWRDLFLVYAILCAGFGMGQAWEGGGEGGVPHRVGDTIGNGFLWLIASPFLPFVVVWEWFGRQRARRAEVRRVRDSQCVSAMNVPGLEWPGIVLYQVGEEIWRPLWSKYEGRVRGPGDVPDGLPVRFAELDEETQAGILAAVSSGGQD